MRVVDHANDLVGGLTTHAEALAECGFIRPPSPRRGPIHQHDAGSEPSVRGAERAALQERDADGGQIGGAYETRLDRVTQFLVFFGPNLDIEATIHRQTVHGAGGLDAWLMLQLLDDVIDKLRCVQSVGVGLALERDLADGDLLRIQAGRGGTHLEKGVEQQRRGREQHKDDRDLCHDEHAA